MADSKIPTGPSAPDPRVRSDYPASSRSLANEVLSEILTDPVRQENIRKVRSLMERSGSKAAG